MIIKSNLNTAQVIPVESDNDGPPNLNLGSNFDNPAIGIVAPPTDESQQVKIVNETLQEVPDVEAVGSASTSGSGV